MRGFRGLGAAVAALTISACGTAAADRSGDTSGTAGGVTSSSSAPRSPGTGSGTPRGVDRRDPGGPTFPLTLRRTGGIAGFDDTVVVQASGELYVDTRTVHGRVCQLAEPQRLQLLDVLSTLRHGGAEVSASPGAESDVIRVSVTDARRHPYDLSDPSLGSVSGMVAALISDVALTTPATVTCRMATS